MKYMQTPDVLSSKIDRDIVLFHEASSSYYTLNNVGTRVWELLNSPKTIDEILEALIAQYEIDEETSRREVLPFLQNLIARKLVQATN
jgi:hypothetical protein